MLIHKYEERLAKDISTLQAEADMLGEGRNQFGESAEHIRAEIELMKRLAQTIDDWMLEHSRTVINRMAKDREGQ